MTLGLNNNFKGCSRSTIIPACQKPWFKVQCLFMSKEEAIRWIEEKEEEALSHLETWVNINSWSHHREGLQDTFGALKKAFSPLGKSTEELPLKEWKIKSERGGYDFVPLGQALSVIGSSSSGPKVLLGGHMDTVYPPGNHAWKFAVKGSRIEGPGVADMKGGLAVLWLALSAFEKFREKLALCWEVLITPDEEIGSPGSAFLWEACAKRNRWGLVFEPAYTEGAIVTERKGSLTLSVSCKGKAAHVGRAMAEGKSAVKGIASFIVNSYKAASEIPSLSINISQLQGGEALNIVPESAFCRVNVRSFDPKALKEFPGLIESITAKIKQEQRLDFLIESETAKFPKLFDAKTQLLFQFLEKSASFLKLPLKTAASGGLSDGNILQQAGLPTLDSLGVVGGALHTHEEWMEKKSLVERAKLVCLLLFELAGAKNE